MCESFFATLECELLAKHRFPSQALAGSRVLNFIEGWYNTRRRHSSINYLSPIQFEQRYEADPGGESQETSFPGCPQNDHHASA